MPFRPNKPPENWYTPGRPSVRSVTAYSEDFDSTPATFDEPLYGVKLSRRDWVRIHKTLSQPDQWEEWCIHIRKVILKQLSSNQRWKQDVFIRLTMDDWRHLWWWVRRYSRRRRNSWTAWFEKVSDAMVQQLKDK